MSARRNFFAATYSGGRSHLRTSSARPDVGLVAIRRFGHRAC